MPFKVISINVGRKLGDPDLQLSFVEWLDVRHKGWQVAFIAEVDGRYNEVQDDNLFGNRLPWRRFWPGPGSTAFAIVFNQCFFSAVRRVQVKGRSVMVSASIEQLARTPPLQHVGPSLSPLEASQDVRSVNEGPSQFNIN